MAGRGDDTHGARLVLDSCGWHGKNSWGCACRIPSWQMERVPRCQKGCAATLWQAPAQRAQTLCTTRCWLPLRWARQQNQRMRQIACTTQEETAPVPQASLARIVFGPRPWTTRPQRATASPDHSAPSRTPRFCLRYQAACAGCRARGSLRFRSRNSGSSRSRPMASTM